MKITKRETCRISQGPLIDVINLGNLPLSLFPSPKDPKPFELPLIVSLNTESSLLQLKYTTNPDELYNNYWYMSGINQSMKDALKNIVDEALKRHPVEPGDVVVDIASNDGTLLKFYPENIFRVGVDPAQNIITQNCNVHIQTYFSKEAYQNHLGDKKADIITCVAMFYDLEDPIQFCKDVNEIMKPDGLWIVQLNYLPTMLKDNAFDSISSEHLGYYSLETMEYIFERSGLEAEDVELNDVNGGCFRIYVRKKGKARPTKAILDMRKAESSMELNKAETYVKFAKQLEINRKEMINFLEEQKHIGKKVIGYGASTRGNTIMSYFGIGPDLVPYVADRNPIKFGRITSTGIPIISEDEARKMNPDFFLAFPYHFIKEFLNRESEFLNRGGKFISPVPKLTIIQ